MNTLNVIVSALNTMILQLAVWVPKLIIAYVIWWLGNWMLDMGLKLIAKIDIPQMKLDDRAIGLIIKFSRIVGKVVLFLVVLDFLGIGSSIIGAVANGLTLTVAITLGLAFGKALEPEAQDVVKEVKKHFQKK